MTRRSATGFLARGLAAGLAGLVATLLLTAGLLSLIPQPLAADHSGTSHAAPPLPVRFVPLPRRVTRPVTERALPSRPIVPQSLVTARLKHFVAPQASSVPLHTAHGGSANGDEDLWEVPALPRRQGIELRPLAPIRSPMEVASELTAMISVAPIYPLEARIRDLSGWVLLLYTVTEQGRVTNLKVLRSKPPGIFDRSALEAARKWRYKPRIVEGKAVAVNNVWSRVSFDATGHSGTIPRL